MTTKMEKIAKNMDFACLVPEIKRSESMTKCNRNIVMKAIRELNSMTKMSKKRIKAALMVADCVLPNLNLL